MERSFPKALSALEEVFGFVGECMAACGADAESAFAVMQAVEELFTNMVKYDGPGRNDIRLRIEAAASAVTVAMSDSDVEPFDITRAPGPDLLAPLEDRMPGGLGLHITKSLVDSISYEYLDRTSIITFTKNLERHHVRDRRQRQR